MSLGSISCQGNRPTTNATTPPRNTQATRQWCGEVVHLTPLSARQQLAFARFAVRPPLATADIAPRQTAITLDDEAIMRNLARLGPGVASFLQRLIAQQPVAKPQVLEATPNMKSVANGTQRKEKNPLEVETVPLQERRWLTVKEAASLFPYTEGAIRHLIFASEGRARYASLKSDGGFINCIFRPPGQRRILIDQPAFAAWIASGKGETK